MTKCDSICQATNLSDFFIQRRREKYFIFTFPIADLMFTDLSSSHLFTGTRIFNLSITSISVYFRKQYFKIVH